MRILLVLVFLTGAPLERFGEDEFVAESADLALLVAIEGRKASGFVGSDERAETRRNPLQV